MEMKSEIKNLGLHGQDLHGFNVFEAEKTTPAEEAIWFGASSNHHHGDADGGGDDLLDDPSSLFYADDFPPLPDFPCMSSSSSSSSTPPQVAKATAAGTASSSASTASSSGPAASWAVLKSDADHDPSSSSMDFLIGADDPHAPPHDDGMDLMQNFGSCIDLLESSDICWDPSPLFDEPEPEHAQLLDSIQEDQDQNQQQQFVVEGEGGGVVDVGGEAAAVEEEDLAVVFFEWLKSNKEMISAEDLRNIKIKKSTIEAAAKRLGGGKEGMKQLLKLILQWVQNHHFQNKKKESQSQSQSTVVSLTTTTCAPPPPLVILDQDNHLNSNTDNIPATTTITNNNNNSSSNNNNNLSSCPVPPPPPFLQAAPTAWMPVPAPPPPPQFVGDPAAMGFPPMVGYMGPPPGQDPYASTEQYHHMMETATATAAPLTWAPSPTAAMQFGMGPPHYTPCPYPPDHAAAHGFGAYGSPYPAAPGFYYHPGLGEGLVRLGASATKEARKKRMARQRRYFSHHHRNHHHHQQSNNSQVQVHQQQINQTVEQHQHQLPGVGNLGGVAAPHPAHGNWVYWPQMPPPLPPPQVNGNPGPIVGQMQMPMQMQQQLETPTGPPPGNGFQRQVGVDKKQQGWKTEKNLRFLLQKVLKQSDVGNLGRIVLPKKEAETHLPELEARDGIPIAMEDIGTSRVWNMRYRFWPNNKSRMYLLENTGDFVRSNGLQEGDFIVIYSDVKCGKYMIRGVKVRQQQQGAKPETPNKKPCKTQKTQGSSSPSSPSSSSPTKQ